MSGRITKKVRRATLLEHNASQCPTPTKRAYVKEQVKAMIRRAEKAFGHEMYAYECACGRMHLATKR